MFIFISNVRFTLRFNLSYKRLVPFYLSIFGCDTMIHETNCQIKFGYNFFFIYIELVSIYFDDYNSIANDIILYICMIQVQTLCSSLINLKS